MATLRLMEAMDAAGHIQWDQAEWRGTCNFCYGYIEDAASRSTSRLIGNSRHIAKTSCWA